MNSNEEEDGRIFRNATLYEMVAILDKLKITIKGEKALKNLTSRVSVFNGPFMYQKWMIQLKKINILTRVIHLILRNNLKTRKIS
jgi:hypothetical protein